MYKKLIVISFLFFSGKSLPQSAWNIGYITGDSIGLKDIGKEIQIDFKNQYDPGEARPYRYSLSRRDTGMLMINNKDILMIEVRKIYDDWGLYEEQYLQSLNFITPGIKLRVNNSILKEVNQDSILINAKIETHKIKKEKSDIVEIKGYDIWIKRNQLSGLIFKMNQ